MVRVVISQSMLFPWVGLLEQLRLADIVVHYDDVQFSKGSFVNRVQLKLPEGTRWLTVPLERFHLGQKIDEVRPCPSVQWRARHTDLLARSLGNAPFFPDVMRLVEEVYSTEHPHAGTLARASLLALARYFGLDRNTVFVDVSTLDIQGAGSDRVLDIVRKVRGQSYITGHGAARYLDHEKFEVDGIQVDYMNYRKLAYPQSHGPFTPFVSGLDLVAHCGRDGLKYICSETLPWKNFIYGSDRTVPARGAG